MTDDIDYEKMTLYIIKQQENENKQLKDDLAAAYDKIEQLTKTIRECKKSMGRPIDRIKELQNPTKKQCEENRVTGLDE
jgi:predicted RNase H-like nuclease (RuvC/YqgF family)